jgi:hypothetical protein
MVGGLVPPSMLVAGRLPPASFAPVLPVGGLLLASLRVAPLSRVLTGSLVVSVETSSSSSSPGLLGV